MKLYHKMSHSVFFDHNVTMGLQHYGKTISKGELSIIKGYAKDPLEVCVIKPRQVFFNLNDGGVVIKMTEIVGIYCFNERTILLLFATGTRLYQFDNTEELYNFLKIMEIDWIIGDGAIFLNPAFLDCIIPKPMVSLEIQLKNLIKLRFEKLQIPGKLISSSGHALQLDYTQKKFIYGVNFKF